MRNFVRAALVAMLLSASPGFASEPPGFAELHWLLGDWVGKGKGEPGHSTSERQAELVLEGKFVRVAGRSVYPKQKENPNGETHSQTDMWGYDRSRKLLTLRQFDTLGFASTYVLNTDASTSDRWVLIAEQLENVPKGWKARYIYVLKSPQEYEEVLELDTDGTGFKPYVTNRFTKVQGRK
jgi:hypothetical protein